MNNTHNHDLQRLEQEIHEYAKLLEQEHLASSYIKRLLELSQGLKHRPGQWYGIDVFRVFDAGVFRQRVYRSYSSRHSRSMKWLAYTREGLFMFIVLFCIFVVHNLSRAFQTAVSLDPAIRETGFFLLWLDRFCGILPVMLSFEWVATIFLTLLAALLLAGAFLKRREQRIAYRAETISDELTEKLEQLLLRIQTISKRYSRLYHANAEQRSIELLEAINQFVDRFESHSSELEKIIAIEQQRLSDFAGQQKNESEKLAHLHTSLQNFSERFASSVSQYQDTLSGFQDIVRSLGQEGKLFADNQKEQMVLLTQATSNSEDLEKEINRLIQVQRKISHDLLQATQQNLEKSNELSTSVNSLNSVTRQVVEGQINLQNLLDDQMRANDSWVRSVGQSITAMTDVLNGIQSFIDSLPPDRSGNTDQA